MTLRVVGVAGPNEEWLAGLSPWPEEFGLGRVHRLLADLGEPQRRYPAIHIVGTNGKTSTTLMTAALLVGAGLRVGATVSPHIRGFAERIQVDGTAVDLEAALARVRPLAEGATQFEVLIAAALAEFAEREVDVAVVEAGLGGRHDATNVLAAPIVVLTNVSLDHTEYLGDTREAIAAEKLAVVTDGAHVVLGEPEWEAMARAAGAAAVTLAGSNEDLAVAAAEAYLGARVDPGAARGLTVPGRLEMRSGRPFEIRDGAHNLAGARYLLERLPDRRFTIVASILADKDAESMLETLARAGVTLVATASANPRALPAEALAALAGNHFHQVQIEPDPSSALALARALAGPDGAVLVTGSLYLIAELSADA